MIERFEFLVEGSQGDEYTVSFISDGQNLNTTCTCRAGENGLWCKHRISLLSGDIDNLLSDNTDDLEKVKKLMPGTPLDNAFNNFCHAEANYDEAKRTLDSAKRKLSRAMYGSDAPGHVVRQPHTEIVEIDIVEGDEGSPTHTKRHQRRTEEFDIEFVGGTAEGWAFDVPEAHKATLDIMQVKWVDKDRSTPEHKVYRYPWTRGAPPLNSFAVGDVFYEPRGTRSLVWEEALPKLRRIVQILKASPDAPGRPGQVEYSVKALREGEVVEEAIETRTQRDFEQLLRYGE